MLVTEKVVYLCVTLASIFWPTLAPYELKIKLSSILLVEITINF